MSIDVHAGNQSWEIGAPSFLFAFFSTVFVRIEGENWGSRFPVLMRSISPTITSLANYFVTSDGRDLLDVLELALSTGRQAKGIRIE